jgi:hypothetical protein
MAMSAGVMSIAGAASSAVGAYGSAKMQKISLDGQAAINAINVRSSSSALDAQADLDLINAKSVASSNDTKIGLGVNDAQAGYSATMYSAGVDEIGGQEKALQLRTGAAVDAIRAGSSELALQVGAQISENAAHLDELQAQSAMHQGEHQEQEVRMEGAQVKSRQITHFAAGNVDLGEGSALNVQNSTDFMTERAAIEIQQKTLMAAFSYRQQEASSLLDAAGKRYQAGMTSVTSSLETGLTESQATAVVANANASADLKRALASIGLDTALSDAATSKALNAAGLTNAVAAVTMKKAIAKINLANGIASTDVNRTLADGIDPNAAFLSSILGSSGKVAESWYSYNRSKKG